MDIATHALLGATLGIALTGPRQGKPAAAVGAIGACLPDIDILLRRGSDPLFALEMHRHFSHSILFALLASAALGVVMAGLFRISKARAVALVLAGYLSAIFLDACTSYGTMLLWPFSAERFAYAVISIVDPVFTGALILGLGIALRCGRRTGAVIALSICVSWLVAAAIQKDRAEQLLQRTIDTSAVTVTGSLVKPSFANILLWRGLVWDNEGITAYALRPALTGVARIYAGDSIERPTAKALADWSGGSDSIATDVERFAHLSRGLLVAHSTRPEMLGDARYALLPHSLEPIWGIEKPRGNDDHVDYVTNRNMSAKRRVQFIAMLKGVDLP